MTGRQGSRVVGDGIWAQEVGEGPLVVLVHGAMDRSGGMLRVRRILQSSCRVVRYDRRGYARSLDAGPPTSFGQQVDDLAAVLDGRPAVLAGHSFGGLVCLALAERRPELARAVLAFEAPMTWAPWWPQGRSGGQGVPAALRGNGASGTGRSAVDDDDPGPSAMVDDGPETIDPGPVPADRASAGVAPRSGAEGTHGRATGAAEPGDDRPVPAAARRRGPEGGDDHDAAEWFLRRMLGDTLWERLPKSMRAERRAEGPTLVAEMRSVRAPAPVPFDPTAITVPVLAAHGSETRPHHVRATEALAELVPRGELAVVAGASHGAHLSHPEEFAALVRRTIELADEAT